VKSFIKKIQINTVHETELINITDDVCKLIEDSGIRDGFVMVMSLHTTTAITVNEGLPDIEADIQSMLEKLVPSDEVYRHARFLPSDGQMAVNAVSHLRSALLGFECCFPLQDGKMVMGTRQTIYLVELDGPQNRTYLVQAIGVC
jgi:secondary thiamine-phosphate synthase enzyme